MLAVQISKTIEKGRAVTAVEAMEFGVLTSKFSSLMVPKIIEEIQK